MSCPVDTIQAADGGCGQGSHLSSTSVQIKGGLHKTNSQEHKSSSPKKKVKWAPDISAKNTIDNQSSNYVNCDDAATPKGEHESAASDDEVIATNGCTYQLNNFNQSKQKLTPQMNIFSTNRSRFSQLRGRMLTLGGKPPQLTEEIQMDATTQTDDDVLTKLQSEVDRLNAERDSVLEEFTKIVQQNFDQSKKLKVMNELLEDAMEKIAMEDEFRDNRLDNYLSIVEGLLKKKNELKSLLAIERDSNARNTLHLKELLKDVAHLRTMESTTKKLGRDLARRNERIKELNNIIRTHIDPKDPKSAGDETTKMAEDSMQSVTYQESTLVDWEDKLEEELASKDAQIQELKMRLKCLQIPINDEDTNDTRERILDLSGDTEKIIQQLLSLEMAYRDSLNENRKLENSLEEANSQLERAKEKQEEERAVIEALEARNDELDRQLLVLNRNQSDYEQLKASLRSMQCDIKKLSKKNRMLCAKYLNLKVRYHHFKSKPDEDANRSWFSKVLSRVW